MAKTKELKVTLLKSKFGRLKSHRACVAGLGLQKDPPDRNGHRYA